MSESQDAAKLHAQSVHSEAKAEAVKESGARREAVSIFLGANDPEIQRRLDRAKRVEEALRECVALIEVGMTAPPSAYSKEIAARARKALNHPA